MLFQPGYRECCYTRKVYCSSCHSGQLRVIPARVIWHWDLNPAPVCDVAASYLDGVMDKPLIDLSQTHPALCVWLWPWWHCNPESR